MVIGDIASYNARLFPNKIGIVDENNRLTWGEVNRRVNSLTNAMLGAGLKKGDRVAIICENSHQFHAGKMHGEPTNLFQHSTRRG